jgi:hypothetical protein
MPNRTPIPSPSDSLEHEFAQERASALGRHGRALEAALRELFELDLARGCSEHSAEHRALRAAFVEQASVALWQFIVQREACGLRDMRAVLRDYHVPAEVAARMGILPGPQPRRH